jgi:hypothetical protein
MKLPNCTVPGALPPKRRSLPALAAQRSTSLEANRTEGETVRKEFATGSVLGCWFNL